METSTAAVRYVESHDFESVTSGRFRYLCNGRRFGMIVDLRFHVAFARGAGGEHERQRQQDGSPEPGGVVVSGDGQAVRPVEAMHHTKIVRTGRVR